MTDNRPPAENDGDEKRDISGQDLEQRLQWLERSLEAKRKKETAGRNPASDASGYAQAFRLSAEFIAGIGVGVALGWGFDKWLGTSPWGLIVFLLLGFAAGVVNVLRAAGLTPEPGVSKARESRADAGRDVRPGEKK